MLVLLTEQDTDEMLKKLEKPVREKRTLSPGSRLRAFQADAGVWATLFELVTALQQLMAATCDTGVQDFTKLNSARARAKDVLKQFTDDEDLSSG